MAAPRPDRVRQVAGPQQQQLPRRPLPTHRPPPRTEQSSRRRRPQPPDHLVAPDGRPPPALHRLGRRLLPATTQTPNEKPSASSPNSPPSATPPPCSPPPERSTTSPPPARHTGLPPPRPSARARRPATRSTHFTPDRGSDTAPAFECLLRGIPARNTRTQAADRRGRRSRRAHSATTAFKSLFDNPADRASLAVSPALTAWARR